MPSGSAGLLLVGGKSRRMGRDKAGIALDGQSLRTRSLACLTGAGLDPVRVSGPDDLPDHYPGAGPLAGIHAGLVNVAAGAKTLIVLPVDMPGVNIDIIDRLARYDSTASLLRFGDFVFPFRLAVSSEIIEALDRRLRSGGDRSVKSFHASLDEEKLCVASSERARFVNLNTPQQVRDFQKGLEA